jgi:hypothetical protein
MKDVRIAQVITRLQQSSNRTVSVMRNPLLCISLGLGGMPAHVAPLGNLICHLNSKLLPL